MYSTRPATPVSCGQTFAFEADYRLLGDSGSQSEILVFALGFA